MTMIMMTENLATKININNLQINLQTLKNMGHVLATLRGEYIFFISNQKEVVHVRTLCVLAKVPF